MNTNDFETDVKNALIKALSENSTGNANSLVNGYMSHLRRFRLFLIQMEQQSLMYIILKRVCSE